MNIQQINPKFIPITKIRRDINTLKKILIQEETAFIVRNQNILFVAMSPNKYEKLTSGKTREERISEAISVIDKIRAKYGKRKKGISASDYIIKMRDERVKRWKK